MANSLHAAPSRRLRVFLCHIAEDKPVVRDIYQKLQRYNIEPWLDEKNLLPGENWEQLIPDVIRICDIVLICLSRTSLITDGYVQYEIRLILEEAKRKTSNSIYYIPLRLDDCEVPSHLAGVHYASNFVPEDFDKLLAACEKRRAWLNAMRATNIEPIYEKISEYHFPQPGLLNRDSGRTGLPDDTISQSIRVEHFDKPTSPNPINVFLSYAYEDEWLLRRLEVHLGGLKREGFISIWCERQIMPGAHWAGVIDWYLEQASLILLLISAGFLASDYCYQVGIKRALERHQAGRAIVIPIIMLPIDWKKTPLAHLQTLPAEAQAVTDWSNPDRAFLEVVSGIREIVEKLASRPPDPTDAVTPIPQHQQSLPPLQQESKGYRQSVFTDSQAARESLLKGPAPNTDVQAVQEFGGYGQQMQVASPKIQPVASRPGARFGAPFPEIWNVPRRHNSFFTGRTSVLDQLFDTFSLENEAGMISLQAVTGLGGMGKTQLAAEYAYRFREMYQAVLWVRADTPENVLADFRTLTGLLKLPQERLQDQTGLMQAMREWFSGQSGWLLIFDNADNPGLVVPFLPSAARGHILATTRAGAVSDWAPQFLPLEALDVEAGALCILRRAGQLKEHQHLLDAPPARVEPACKLADMMKGLPLALEQAGAYINDTACGVRKYLELYKQHRVEIRSHPYGEVREYSQSVASVWKISRSIVEQSNAAAAELLKLCAFLAPEAAIPYEVVFNGASALGPVLGPVAANEIQLDEAIKVLRRYSLLHREVDDETELTRLSIHRVMQEVIIDEMDERTQRLWAGRAVCAVEQSFQSLPEPWPLLQAHSRECQQMIERWQMTFPEARRLLKWIEKFDK